MTQSEFDYLLVRWRPRMAVLLALLIALLAYLGDGGLASQ